MYTCNITVMNFAKVLTHPVGKLMNISHLPYSAYVDTMLTQIYMWKSVVATFCIEMKDVEIFFSQNLKWYEVCSISHSQWQKLLAICSTVDNLEDRWIFRELFFSGQTFFALTSWNNCTVCMFELLYQKMTIDWSICFKLKSIKSTKVWKTSATTLNIHTCFYGLDFQWELPSLYYGSDH